MQKLLLATAVAISTSFASFAAFADDSAGGAFVHAGIGKTNHLTQIKTYDGRKARGADIMGGYRWNLGHSFALGVEGGYAYLGEVERNGPRPAGKQESRPAGKKGSRPAGKNGRRLAGKATGDSVAKDSMSTGAWLIGVNAKWNMTDHLSLTGRAGSASVRTNFKHRDAGSKETKNVGTASRRVPYFGLGMGYAVTDHLDLTVQATRYGSKSVKMKNEKGKGNDWSATTFNAGAEYRF